MKNIGQTLLRLRTEQNLSQRELAALLARDGVHVTNQAVSKWENNLTQPNTRQFLALLRALKVRDAVAVFTGTPPADPLEGFNAEGRAKVRSYIDDLAATGRYRAAASLRRLPLYRLAASAGTGQFLDQSEAELVPVGEEVPAAAEFGVRLAGDSMEPRYHDGQVVWVQRQESLRSGEIGIFLYDDCAYCKLLSLDAQGARLLSLNPAYAPIVLREDETLTVFGRVVS